MSDTGTCVYRVYDTAGSLLYVGCTGNLSQRLSNHAATSAWYCQTDKITTEWHDDRAAALRAESRAIFTESPIHNVNGVRKDSSPPDYSTRVAHVIRDAIGAAGMSLAHVARHSTIPYATLHRRLNDSASQLNVLEVQCIAAVLGVRPGDLIGKVA